MHGFRLAVVVGCALAVGCDDDGIRQNSFNTNNGTTVGTTGGSSLGACDRADLDGSCFSYVGVDWTEADALADCNNGQWAPGEQCVRIDHLGYCAQAPNTSLEKWVHYYDGAYYGSGDVGDLESQCTVNGGIWL